MSAEGSPSWEVSQSDAMKAPPGFNTRNTSRASACLSGMWTMESLEKPHRNCTSPNGRGPGSTCTRSMRSLTPASRMRSRAVCEHRCLDIDAGDVRCAVLADQKAVDAAGATADVQHVLAFEVFILKQPGQLLRPTRRQPAAPPQQLEKADDGFVDTGRLGQPSRGELLAKLRGKPT
jgi:hypothetical protein